MSGKMNYDLRTKENSVNEKKKSGRDLAEQNAVGSYLNALRNYPQLKHTEFVELFQLYEAGRTKRELVEHNKDVSSEHDDDDESSTLNANEYVLTPEALKIRNRLVECNLRLVVSIAKQYRTSNIPIEDLIQEGNIGLMKSIDRFDWRKGFRFSTYATWWIRQAIGQHVLKRKRMIRLPAHAVTLQRKLLQAAEEYRTTMGCEPTPDELMEILGASEAVVKATLHAGRDTISLQQPLSSSTDDTVENRVEDMGHGADPFENVAEKQLVEIVKRVLMNLSPKEAAILRLRFGLVDDSTDNETYPITEEEIKQVMSGKGLT